MGITVPPRKVSCQTTRTDNLYHAFTLFILLGALAVTPPHPNAVVNLTLLRLCGSLRDQSVHHRSGISTLEAENI